MKLLSIEVRDSPPVQRFEAGDLSNLVVLAGPNGVGKTRLIQSVITYLRGGGPQDNFQVIVRATSESESTAWQKDHLDLTIPQDLGLFRATTQVSRRRKNWTSSLINFESDRTIQNLQHLQFSWDAIDPEDEEIGWETTFGFMHDRFQDTVHSMFRMIESQKMAIAGRAIQLRRGGATTMNLEFTDPMEPFKQVFSMLLAPKELVEPSARNQQLEYSIDGQIFNFNTLSSGEREVVNIAFDFQLRRPQDCIIFFDEPELHLHPELSYKLLSTLQSIGARNQFVLSTHSPDIITSSLDQTVIFLSPPRALPDGAPDNQAIEVSESDETNQALRLLGQSIGIVALGKRIVLIEGENSSLDKQTYGSILRNQFPGLVLVPSGGKHVIESFDLVYKSVLSRSIWGVDFFMLCDRDSEPLASTDEVSAISAGRLRLLPGYHIENAFLDENVWAEGFKNLFAAGSWQRDPMEVKKVLQETAVSIVSYATALSVSFELRRKVGNADLMASGVNGLDVTSLADLVIRKVREESDRIDEALNEVAVRTLVETSFERLSLSVTDGSDSWKKLIPGKPLLAAFANKAGLKTGQAKQLYISTAAESVHDPFADVKLIFEQFSTA